MTKATAPPMPSAPKLGTKASSTMKAMPEQHQRQAGVVDRQRLEREQRDQQAMAPITPGIMAPGLESSKIRP